MQRIVLKDIFILCEVISPSVPIWLKIELTINEGTPIPCQSHFALPTQCSETPTVIIEVELQSTSLVARQSQQLSVCVCVQWSVTSGLRMQPVFPSDEHKTA